MNNNELKNLIHTSSLAQRNWDITVDIPEEDIETLIYAATMCPSKQNRAYYKVDVITNRDIIERIWNLTPISKIKPDRRKNAQVLANVLFVFSHLPLEEISDNAAVGDIANIKMNPEKNIELFRKNVNTSIGIAAAYTNMAAHMLGYKTGFCACFDYPAVKEEYGFENATLMLGVGVPNASKDRLEHHYDGLPNYNSIPKQTIKVNRIK